MKRLAALPIVVVAALCMPSSAAALIVDDFTAGGGSMDLSGLPPSSAGSTENPLDTSHTIGGVRETNLAKSAGSAGEHVTAVWNPPAGMLNLTKTGAALGQLTLFYDGTVAGPPNPDGMSQNFSAAGDGMLVRATSSVPAPITVRLLSSATSGSTTTIGLSPGVSTYYVPFSDFTTDPGTASPANFADIGEVGVGVAIEAGSRTIDDLSVEQDSDGDGSPSPLDCDDNDPARAPDRIELVGNTVDENCDGIVAVIPAAAAPSATASGTGLRAAAFKRCKKKKGHARKACKKKAQKLPL